jgi:hypothetical protein
MSLCTACKDLKSFQNFLSLKTMSSEPLYALQRLKKFPKLFNPGRSSKWELYLITIPYLHRLALLTSGGF